MQEQQVLISTNDGHTIYCTLGTPSAPTKAVVLVVHGFTGGEYGVTQVLTSMKLQEEGLAYCRVNLYGWQEGARKMNESDFLTHSKDVDEVAKYLREELGYTKVFAAGHSFGGIVLLQLDHSLYNGYCFQDISTVNGKSLSDYAVYDETTQQYYLEYGIRIQISERYLKGIMEFPDQYELAAKIPVPVQVVHATGKTAGLEEVAKQYYQAITTKKEIVAIEGGHCFYELTAREAMPKAVAKWFLELAAE
jgi:esterase/lipase